MCHFSIDVSFWSLCVSFWSFLWYFVHLCVVLFICVFFLLHLYVIFVSCVSFLSVVCHFLSFVRLVLVNNVPAVGGSDIV